MSGGWGLCQQDPSHASSLETPLQLSEGPVGSGLQEKGVPLATRTQAGRGQTRWAHRPKAKAEPGWGAHEPEAGVGKGPGSEGCPLGNSKDEHGCPPPHGHRSCLPGRGHHSGLYPTPQGRGLLSRSPRPGPWFSAHSTHTEGSGGEDGDPRATRSGIPLAHLWVPLVLLSPVGVCRPPSTWSLPLAWLGLSEPCTGGHREWSPLLQLPLTQALALQGPPSLTPPSHHNPSRENTPPTFLVA